MEHRTLSRRELVKGGLAAAALAVGNVPLSAFGFPEPAEGDEVVPFLDPQPVNPNRPMLHWQDLTQWITPTEQLFAVSHYGTPKPQEDWHLEITGLVEHPMSLTLDDLKARPRAEYVATLECSGNGAGANFMGAIGNCRWAGTPLAPILAECGVKPEGIEVVFFAADTGKEKIREGEYEQQFARSLSLEDATKDNVLLAYEVNGEPLSQSHGYPVRLIVPGWFGIAWVKWPVRIEVHDRRFMNRFMGRDYVTIRGEKQGDQIVWRETAVGLICLKSIVARVVRREDGTLRITGAAWNDGTPLKAVELKIDDGPWTPTELDKKPHAEYAWTFWSYDWKNPPPGEHTLVSRAVDAKGRVQPSADDSEIALKKTYWEANQQVPRRIKV